MSEPGTPVVWGPCAACDGTGISRSIYAGPLPCASCDGRGGVVGYATKVAPLGWGFVAGPPAPTWEQNCEAHRAKMRATAETADIPKWYDARGEKDQG